MPDYNDTFFSYVSESAIRSARALLPVVAQALHCTSILDVGCGQGGWLAEWKKLGATTVHGIDGDYVNQEHLLIDRSEYSSIDLQHRFNLSKKFDLVQCLEVGEHLPETSARSLVDSLVNHGDLVLFSAAPPGQGGDHHVNEQAYDYWRLLFRAKGFQCFDYFRPRIQEKKVIDPWYRFNTFLYVNESCIEHLDTEVRESLVPEGVALKDISPAIFRIRKALVRLLPLPVTTKIAKIKDATLVRKRKVASPSGG